MNFTLIINPNDDEVHYNLADLLKKRRNIDEAEKHYRKAIGINPNNAMAHINIADIIKRKGDTNEAEKHYRRAVEINSEFTEVCITAHCNLAILLMEKGKLDEAEEHCQKAIELNPNFTEARNNLAKLLDQKIMEDKLDSVLKDMDLEDAAKS